MNRSLIQTISDIPSLPIDDILEDPNKDEDLIPPNERRPMRMLDSRRQGDGELSDSDDEGEGGRRNHADNREASTTRSDGNDSTNGPKFGMGVGIMSSGQTGTTHGAGPSGHTTVPPVIATVSSREGSAMEVDETNSTSASNTAPAIPSPLGAKEKTPDSVTNDMAVDPPTEPTATS